MDKKFDDWQKEHKEFCSKAKSIEIQILYVMYDVQCEVADFMEKMKSFDKNYQEVDLNRIVNKVSSIRSYIRHLKGERNRF